MLTQLLILSAYTGVCILFLRRGIFQGGADFKFPRALFAAAIIAAFAIRIFFALSPINFSYDINCFKAWSGYATSLGFGQLYGQDFFLDYPPGYMYVLFVLRSIGDFFKLNIDGIIYTMMIKLPSIIADFGCGYLVYKVGRETLNDGQSKLLTLIFLFCPAIIHNSSVWGQIDSFYIFFVALAICFAYKNRTVPAAIAFAYGILVKPQAIFFGPIFLFYIIERRSVKEFFKAAIAGLGTLYLLVLPFSPNPFDLSWIVTLYKDTMGGLQYFTVNAYNLYAILGLNWVELDAVRSSWMINVAVISSLVAFVGFAFLKLKGKAKFFYLSGFIILVVFCFTTMMHERYLFPAIIFFLLAFLLTKRKSLFYIFLGISGLNYINCVAVMRSFFSDSQLSQFLITLLSLAVIACFVLCIYMIIKQLHKTNSLDFSLGAKHGIAIFALTCVYGVFALFDLGSFDAPQSYFLSGADNVSFDVIFDEPTNIASIYSFSGVGDEFSGDLAKKATCDFDIYYTQDNQSFQYLLTLEKKDVFKWGQDVCDVAASGIRVVAANPGQVLGEILFARPDGSVISGRLENYNVSADYPAENALDESECLPDDLSYYNSSYFDEIYHARTAYEQLHGYSIYETTHPPLGKILISIGIKIFGMTPFGWRIVGAVCGIAMLPIFYLLARGIFKSFFAAFAATCLLALDFMHITQTRIATVDTYVVFFTILTFLFMLYYHKTKFTDSLNKQFLYLTLSGIFMACAVATKWNGAYSMVGLALFFFISLYEKYKSSAGDKLCRARVAKTILFCFVAFVGIPVVIYILTFIPVVHTTGIFNYLKEVWRCQVNMFNYHSTLVAEHFFSSLWYTWPFTVKPIWYSITMLPQGMASSISAFGNPLIWWLTPFATVAACVLAYRKKDSRLWLIVLGFVFSLLPWVFVTRLSFIYHYFPSAIFGILAIAAVIDWMVSRYPKSKKYGLVYLLACLALFLAFVPITTGIAAPNGYLESLEWFPSWHFINTN